MRLRRGEIYQMSVSVSIHASVKDATLTQTKGGTALFGFNPRICKRCDTSKPDILIALSVSIHASVKDATREVANVTLAFYVSIHASVKDATRYY